MNKLEDPRNGPRMLTNGLLFGILCWTIIYGIVVLIRKVFL